MTGHAPAPAHRHHAQLLGLQVLGDDTSFDGQRSLHHPLRSVPSASASALAVLLAGGRAPQQPITDDTLSEESFHHHGAPVAAVPPHAPPFRTQPGARARRQ